MFASSSCLLTILLLASAIDVSAQRSAASSGEGNQPKEVRGYKVHRTEVEIKRNKKSKQEEFEPEDELLIRLGEARLVSATPLGVTFDVPVIVAPVKQQGDVDRLVFEDMLVNETSVTIEDYAHQFKLPNREPLTLAPPVRIFVSTPQAVVRVFGELLNSKEEWSVSGRVYVCGHFKRFMLKFKRAIPVQVQASIKNPLR